MPEPGDVIYGWQEQTPDGAWGFVAAYIPLIGLPGPLHHRSEQIAREMFGPIARDHCARSGNPLRLARFQLTEVLDA